MIKLLFLNKANTKQALTCAMLIIISYSLTFCSFEKQEKSIQIDSTNDILGFWQVKTIIYYNKLRLHNLENKNIFYYFAKQGEGHISKEKNKISDFRYFSENNELYIKREEPNKDDNIKLNDKLPYLNFEKSFYLEKKQLVGTLKIDTDTYFFDLVKSNNMQDIISLIVIEKAGNNHFQKTNTIQETTTDVYYNILMQKPIFYRYQRPNYNQIGKMLFPKRVIINQGKRQTEIKKIKQAKPRSFLRLNDNRKNKFEIINEAI